MADFFAVEVVGAGSACDIVGGDEVEPLLAVGVIPDGGGVENMVEFFFADADREKEAAVLEDLPVRFAEAVVIGEEEGVELAVKAINFWFNERWLANCQKSWFI